MNHRHKLSPTPPAEFPPEFVRELSCQVYLERLAVESARGGLQKWCAEKKKDFDAVVRERAVFYDPMVRVTLSVLKSRGVDVLAGG